MAMHGMNRRRQEGTGTHTQLQCTRTHNAHIHGSLSPRILMNELSAGKLMQQLAVSPQVVKKNVVVRVSCDILL